MELNKLLDELASDNSEFAKELEQEQAFFALCDLARKQLVEMRKAAKLRQEEVAERLDMSQSAISRMERGTGDIGLATIARYAAALGVRPVLTFVPVNGDSDTKEKSRLALSAVRRMAERRRRMHSHDKNEHYSALAQRSVSDAADLADADQDEFESSV